MVIKLLIADDDPLIREGLRIILGLDEEFEVVACVENGRQAVEYCLGNRVDVALLDVRMPVMNGVQATREICAQTGTKPLILTTFDDDEYITDAIKYGAKGYLLKNSPPGKIKEAIRVVHGGNTVMQGVVLEKIKEGLGANKSGRLDRTMFTGRELEIMELIARGRSNKEIAGELFISEGTVKNYITSILDKTGLDHRTQIAIYYINGGKL
ncbi:MAG: response regulator transcription factor [Peptococcaceae bacterium]|nr:response regulator transcription factor [Peptococcaceae bacterium]